MNNKTYTTIVLGKIVIWLLLSGICHAAETNSSYQALLHLIEKEQIIGLGFWNPGDTSLLCIVAWHTKEEDPFQRRKMFFFQQIDHRFIKVYEETNIGYGFDSMYPVNDDLLTIWAAGSGFGFRVFSLVDHTIQVTLDSGSQQLPEIVDVDNDGQYEILVISDGKFMINAGDRSILRSPEATEIYKWNGQKYELLKTVPWKQRLCEEASESKE